MSAAAATDRLAVARALREIARRLSLDPSQARFRAQAYERGARSLERTTEDLGRLIAENRLTALPGIGDGLAAVITELHTTGRSERLERMREELPTAVVELAAAVGLPTARTLHAALGVDSVDALREACARGAVREVPGFGAKREAALLERLRRQGESGPARLLLSEALDEGERLAAQLSSLPDTLAVVVGGARRGCETVDGVDVLVVTEEAATLESAVPPGHGARLSFTTPVRAAFELVRRTGSERHVQRLLDRAATRGVDLARIRGDESAVYEALGLPFIPPELREDEGEIEAAHEGRLPELLLTSDLVGAVHCHTVASDGRHTLLQMARAAEARGFLYMTVTDHSPSAHYARGLTVDRLERQWEEIAQVQEEVKIRLLRGTECDITREGALDWPDRVLEQLDVVIASIHERFKMDSAAMTRRVLSALRHPCFKIWGHPLGRKIPSRPPFECDLEAILDALAESRGAVEINGDPHRLDLEPRLVRAARARGLKFVVSTDAHAIGELGYIRYGTLMARRGWLTRGDVLNTLGVDEFARTVRPMRKAPGRP